MTDTIVVSSAFPFVPAELNLAHFASTYIPADVYSRFLKIFEIPNIHVCATDVHSIMASQDGRKRDLQLCNEYHKQYIDIFKLMEIKFDYYIRTDDQKHIATVNDALLRLNKKRLLYTKKTTNLICNDCKIYLPLRLAFKAKKINFKDAKNPEELLSQNEFVCPYCNSRNGYIICKDQFFLKTTIFENFLNEKSNSYKSSKLRNIVKGFLKQGLEDWVISRNNNIGIPFPLSPVDKSIYIWFESLLCYYTLCCEANSTTNPNFVHFIGKNIIYYHTIIWPILLKEGLNLTDFKLNISPRGFLQFNKSDKNLIDIKSSLKMFPCDYLRFYCLYKSKDSLNDYNFSVSEVKLVCNKFINERIGNTLYRIWLLLLPHSEKAKDVDLSDEIVVFFYETLSNRTRNNLNEQKINSILKDIFEYVKKINKRLMDKETRDCSIKYNNGLLTFMGASLLTVLNPFMPKLTEEFSIFSSWVPNNINTILSSLNNPIRKQYNKWPFFK